MTRRTALTTVATVAGATAGIARALAGGVTPSVSIMQFGATPGGDAAAPLQAAIDHLGTGGGRIVIPAGDWLWRSVPRLPHSLTGTLTISGYGARIALTASGPRVFDLNKTADHQSFRSFHVAGLEVDCAAHHGASHVLIGSRIDNAFIGPFNAHDGLFEDILLRNIPNHQNIPGQPVKHHASVVCLSPFHPAPDAATQSRVTGWTFRNVRAHGGDGGFQINGFCAGRPSANVYFDDINIVDCGHILPPARHYYHCSHVHIGGFGFGDRCTIKGFRGSNSGDNGIETNAMQRTVIDDVRFDGFTTYGCFFDNYHAAQNVAEQTVTLRNHHYRLNYPTSRAVSFGQEGGASRPFGHIRSIDMVVTSPQLWNGNGLAFNLRPNGQGSKKLLSLRSENLVIDIDVTGQIFTENYASFVAIKLADEAPVTLDNTRIRVRGTPAGFKAGATYPRIIESYGKVRLTNTDFHVDWQVAGFDGLWINYIEGDGKTAYLASGHRYKSAVAATTAWRVQGAPFDAAHILRFGDGTQAGRDFHFSDPRQARFTQAVGDRR